MSPKTLPCPGCSFCLIGQVMVEAYRRDATSKDQLIGELKATKKRLDSELKELRQELIKVQGEKKSVDVEHVRLQKEASHVRQQMADLEGHLQAVQRERDEMETHLQVRKFSQMCPGVCCVRVEGRTAWNQSLLEPLSWRDRWTEEGTREARPLGTGIGRAEGESEAGRKPGAPRGGHDVGGGAGLAGDATAAL